MTDSLFEAVALCSQELMKYSLSAEEFAVLAQKKRYDRQRDSGCFQDL